MKTKNILKKYFKTFFIALFCCSYTGVFAQEPVVDSKGSIINDLQSKWTLNGTDVYNKNTGNVGVNVNVVDTPLVKLHVNGTMRIDSFLPGEGSYILVKDPATMNMAQQLVAFNSLSVGDIKYSFNTNDHLGWVKLDGRAVGTLSATQQANATSLGYGTNLPNATDAYLTQNGSAFGTINGSNSVVLAQTNMPNITYTGTTTTDGNHYHSVTAPRSRNRGSGANAAANTFGTANTSTNGNHTHTATTSTGGSGTPINITPQSLNTNAYIYLGL